MKISRAASYALITTLITAGMASAANNVHLKPPKKTPSFTDQGLSLAVSGNLAGLGNGDIIITLSAMADVYSTCTNRGGKQAPGQNPAPLTVSGSQSIPQGETKNGNVSFNLATVAPDPVIAGAPDCPNKNWTEEIEDLAFTKATISVQQPMDNYVLQVSCDFIPATDDGSVPGGTVYCSL